MLFGIDPVLGPDMLHTLRAMGHGDEIAIVDGNYPAAENARRLVRADGVGLLPLLEAVFRLMPVEGIFRASEGNDATQSGAIHHEIEATAARLARGVGVTALDGAALYPRIRGAYAIVATSEVALYANVILRKGVIGPPPKT